MEAMSAEEARKNFADLLNKVGIKGEEVVITRHGKPLVKMVPAVDDEGADRGIKAQGGLK